MKTSELLRKAIDNHLSSAASPDEYQELMNDHHIMPYLCWTIVFAALAWDDVDLDGGLLLNVNRLSEKHRALICRIESETGFLSMHVDGTSCEEIQQMRYMYADFLAYYFDDMGD